jgi:hypothetical protein
MMSEGETEQESTDEFTQIAHNIILAATALEFFISIFY